MNHSPSFSIDTPLDMTVKEALLTDTLRLVHMDPSGILKMRMQEKKGAISRLYGRGQSGGEGLASQTSILRSARKEDPFDEFEKGNRGKYDRIYPSDDKNLNELYRIFLAGAEAAFKHSFHMRIKDTISRVREERRLEEQAKEAEEKRKVKARFEMRRKAQRSARLAALAARARIVEKLTARMQEEIQSLVPVRGTCVPPTLHEKPHVSPLHISVAHPNISIHPVAQPQLTEMSRNKSSDDAVKVSDLYGIMEHCRCRPKSRSSFTVKAAGSRSSQAATNALNTSESTPRPKALCPLRYSGTGGEMWNSFFTKPFKDINARELVATSSFLKDHYDIMKSPGILNGPMQSVRLTGWSDSSHALFQQYQRKLPALSQNGYSMRTTNTLSVPTTSFSELGSKYIVKAVPPGQQAKVAAKARIAPPFSDIMRAHFGLPRIGDHTRWKPSTDHILSRRTPGNDRHVHMRSRASFNAPVAHSSLGRSFPYCEHGKMEKKKKASQSINDLFRERKTVSRLRM